MVGMVSSREDIAVTQTPPERIALSCSTPGAVDIGTDDSCGEPAVLAPFVAHVNFLLPGEDLPSPERSGILAAVQTVAAQVDAMACTGQPTGYGRCVLHDDPAGWSLAVIALRPGQTIPPHDHAAWGGAAAVQGAERNRLFAEDGAGGLVLVEE